MMPGRGGKAGHAGVGMERRPRRRDVIGQRCERIVGMQNELMRGSRDADEAETRCGGLGSLRRNTASRRNYTESIGYEVAGDEKDRRLDGGDV